MTAISPKQVSWALVALMLAVGVQSALVHESAVFGYLHDDSLYLVTANSIAAGDGFWLPSMPQPTPATKYPPLFAALLSLAWIGDLDYPENLWIAHSLVVLFGIAFVPLCYVAIRDFGAGRGWAFAITAIAAFHPVMTGMRRILASEMLFFTLVYAAIICCERSAEYVSKSSKGRLLWLAGCVFCLGATLTRTMGITAAIGIAIYFMIRGRWLRAGGVMLASLLGILAPLYLAADAPQLDLGSAPAGYVQTLTYYQSYIKFWVLSLPEPSLWPSYLIRNAFSFFIEPAALVLPTPMSVPWMRMVAVGLNAAGSLMIFVEIARRAFAGEARSLHFALPFCGGILVLWNYPQMGRFELLFLPLFLWSGKLVVDRWKVTLAAATSGPGFNAEKLLGYCYLGVAASWFALSCYTYLWQAPQADRAGRVSRAAAVTERRQAYDWIKANTNADDAIIAYEDAVLYLETDRKSMRPINLTTRCGYFPDDGFIETELARISDTARYVEAKYWLQTDFDYIAENAATSGHLRAATDLALSEHVEVFRSSNSRAKIFELNWD